MEEQLAQLLDALQAAAQADALDHEVLERLAATARAVSHRLNNNLAPHLDADATTEIRRRLDRLSPRTHMRLTGGLPQVDGTVPHVRVDHRWVSVRGPYPRPSTWADRLKIDRAFVARMPEDGRALRLLRAMVALAEALDVRVVEGP